MTTISLNGLWTARSDSMARTGTDGLAEVKQAVEGWIPAQVPGEIHLDLMRAGQMPDPAVGANMPGCRWPETRSWWYRTHFEVDVDFLGHERQQLVFDGLDLYAQVFVNGQFIGEAANAFVPAVFDVKHLVVDGENELVVRLTVGSELASTPRRRDRGKPPSPTSPPAALSPTRPLRATQGAGGCGPAGSGCESRSSPMGGTG